MSVKTAEQRPRADVGAAIVERAVSAISGSRSFRRWRSSPYGLRILLPDTRAASILRECDTAHTSLLLSSLKSRH